MPKKTFCAVNPFISLILLFNVSFLWAVEEEQKSTKDEPPKVGFFSLPGSQQPSVLFGFGGNIIDKGETQVFLFTGPYIGKKRKYSEIAPQVLYGISDDLSILFNFHFSPYQQEKKEVSRGLFDWIAQLEYAFYTKSTKTYVNQATLVGAITAPTGSPFKKPPTGLGVPGLFLGSTYYHMRPNWFYYFAPGSLITFNHNGTKMGSQYLVELAVGLRLPSLPHTISAFILEIDNIYTRKDKIRGKINHNSGGNVVYVNPSYWFSTKDIQLQLGLSFPVIQNYYGKQKKFDYGIEINFAKSFY